ncbi:hypothetical protein ACFU3O_20690 [Streptomyces antibioticus]|uniref:hypothetical protein n=1 Tax=Streptomyces antibioticus TaxID=1890 RepID=UPI00368D2E63
MLADANFQARCFDCTARHRRLIVPLGGKAAIGAVYFLARLHPRSDDTVLAIRSIND